MIVRPAIKTADDTIWSTPAPTNHGHVFNKIAKAIGYVINDDSDPAATARWVALTRPHVMGFITDQGIFLGRREAWLNAVASGQKLKYWSPARIAENMGPDSKAGLSSEDLWEDEWEAEAKAKRG